MEPSATRPLCWALALLLIQAVGPAAAQAAAPAPRARLDAWLGQHAPSRLAGPALPAADAQASPKLLVFGHAYGSPAGARARKPRPAESLTRNEERLAARKPDLVVSLGDIVYRYADSSIGAAVQCFAALGAPVLNAVGNHEMAERKAYTERFGPSFGALRLGDNLLFVLDTERRPWSLSAPQLEFLQTGLELARPAGIRRVLLFAHKLIFSVEDARYGPLLAKLNAHDHWTGESNYKKQVLPLLEAFNGPGREVFWFGGDIGVGWNYGLFYDRHPASGITYVATGIGDQAWDNVLEVRLTAKGPLQIEALSLTGEALPELESCGLEFWAQRFPKWANHLPEKR